MFYFVKTADDQRYGPADIDTLVSWVGEGRLAPETTLIERGTERHCRADSIAAVAAAFRRASGARPAVSVERDGAVSNGFPTMTQGPGVGAPRPPAVPSPATLPHARSNVGPKSKLAAGLLGIFLGQFGVHRFYLGYVGIGIIQILVTCASCGIGGIWGFVEGIICLCGGMQDADGYELSD